MIHLKFNALWVVWVCVLIQNSRGAVIHIPIDFSTIQEGIDAAQDGDTILLADGIYTGTGNTNLHWNGHEKHLQIASENGTGSCVLDGQDLSLIFNLNLSGQSSDDRIVGINIRNGFGPICGGIYCCGISLSMENCKFEHCQSSSTITGFGGAIYCLDSSLQMTDCEFTTNSSHREGGAVFSYDGTLLIDSCQFSDNTSTANLIFTHKFCRQLILQGIGVNLS